ncbi:leucine--tRNA ligase, partial [Candidatus Parcubacteria bacterium]|nr:leucine--tRNA ligase [Candidatus Parcubacteria bacterium]
LAYKSKQFINWCPKDKIGLANEEVVDGKCERCGTPVEKREKEQWMLAITKYAQRLYDDLETVDFPERVKSQQRNWIGPSEGALIKFAGENESIEVFTTRPDTIFGATFIVRAGKEDKFTGQYVVNPATKEKIPVWEAEYVYSDYGTGAIMGVPAHDERDHAFAKKHGLPIVSVISPSSVAVGVVNPPERTLRNSNNFNGFDTKDARKKITKFLNGEWVTKFKLRDWIFSRVTKFKLRDWIFSRQRYWGEPIPVILCAKCGAVPVPVADLPVTLPDIGKYEPTDTGESPLANIDSWVNVKCPKCGGEAKRETDTMPNWAGSSWYYLRYADPRNDKDFASKSALKHWMPVDWYNGGMEHTTLHLLYSRFWNKFLFDIGLVPTSEPYKKRTSHGLILAEGGVKMSKSLGNVVNPDTIVEMFGADTLRLYEMFMGPFEQAIAWSESSLVGPRRFLERVWKLREKISDAKNLKTDEFSMNQVVKKVSDDIETLGFNTAVSSLMIYVNELEKKAEVTKTEYETLLQLLAPFAPHITEELWSGLGHSASIHSEPWPKYDESKLERNEVTYAVQVNGKVRASFLAAKSMDRAELEKKAQALPEVAKWLSGKAVDKVIVIPGKVVNIVVS